VTGWKSLSSGASFVLAIGSNDSLYSWGFNGTGEIGVPTGTSNNTSPVNVKLPSGVLPASVAAGHNHGFIIGSDGLVYSWGANGQGQLGINSTTGSGSNSAVTIYNVDSVGATGQLRVGTIPLAPVLIIPANHSTDLPTSLTLKWNKVPGATGYNCQVSSDPSFVAGRVVDNGESIYTTLVSYSDTSVQLISPLDSLTKYFWHVAGIDTAGAGVYADGVFTTGTGLLGVDGDPAYRQCLP